MRIDGVIFDGEGLFEGARHFREELSLRGIPVVVSRGTHGYSSALQDLGTPADTTWVVTSSPSSLARARGAGMRTACVLAERDAPRQAAIERECDILVRGLGELTLGLIDDYAPPVPDEELSGQLRVLIVNGSPEPSSPALVRCLAEGADYVVAADRGAESLHAAGVVPDVFCGDSDSVSPEVAAWARQRASADILYPTEKYESDLALAVACARHEAARLRKHLALTLTCTSGGRPDHALTVLGSLVKALDGRPRVVEDGFECRLLAPGVRDEWTMAGVEGQTFSVIALEAGTVVSERGSKWELDHREIDFLGGWGLTLSNEVVADPCTVTCHAGLAAVFLIA